MSPLPTARATGTAPGKGRQAAERNAPSRSQSSGGVDVFESALRRNQARRGELMGSVVVSSGKDPNQDQAALFRLETSLQRNAEDHGMPNMIADNLSTTQEEAAASLRQLTSSGGPAIIKAIAPADIYAHGPLETMLVVSPFAR